MPNGMKVVWESVCPHFPKLLILYRHRSCRYQKVRYMRMNQQMQIPWKIQELLV